MSLNRFELRAEVIKHYKACLNIRATARKFGMNYTTVRSWVIRERAPLAIHKNTKGRK